MIAGTGAKRVDQASAESGIEQIERGFNRNPGTDLRAAEVAVVPWRLWPDETFRWAEGRRTADQVRKTERQCRRKDCWLGDAAGDERAPPIWSTYLGTWALCHVRSTFLAALGLLASLRWLLPCCAGLLRTQPPSPSRTIYSDEWPPKSSPTRAPPPPAAAPNPPTAHPSHGAYETVTCPRRSAVHLTTWAPSF